MFARLDFGHLSRGTTALWLSTHCSFHTQAFREAASQAQAAMGAPAAAKGTEKEQAAEEAPKEKSRSQRPSGLHGKLYVKVVSGSGLKSAR